MPDVTERTVTAVTIVSVTSLSPRPTRSLTSDERKPAAWVDTEGCIMLDDTVRVKVAQNCIRYMGKKSGSLSVAQSVSKQFP
jgi:hypothetical protein